MEKQRWEESKKSKAEERRSEKRKAEERRSEKSAKHTIVGTLLEVEMVEKWTPLWREARFEVLKKWRSGDFWKLRW